MRALVVGEVLWDLFPEAARLGGAPLNVAAHLRRLGHRPRLVSALGCDALGLAAHRAVVSLGVETTWLQATGEFATGTARVRIAPGQEPAFTIARPAAYDAVQLSPADLEEIAQWQPSWCYYGTLFPASAAGGRVLRQVLDAAPAARRFYDLNLRPGFHPAALVRELLETAAVVKVNAHEMTIVRRWLGLPSRTEHFCRAGAARYGWQAVCVTRGADGCAILVGDVYAEAPGVQVTVADTVGAGDAFAAAVLHGLSSGWSAPAIATFANRMGADAVARPGAIADAAPLDPVGVADATAVPDAGSRRS